MGVALELLLKKSLSPLPQSLGPTLTTELLRPSKLAGSYSLTNFEDKVQVSQMLQHKKFLSLSFPPSLPFWE